MRKITVYSLITLLIISVATSLLYNKLRKIEKKIQIVDNIVIDSVQEENDVSYFSKLSDVSLSTPTSREKFLAEIQQVKGNQLEIGPFFTPVLKGENISYFDVLDREGLIEKARNENIDPTNIPEKVHYVEQYGNMDIIQDKFQLIFSSHNIEHQVNLVKHFNQIERLLEKGGKFYLAIPDKRYCFDHFINVTPISEVLAVYYENPTYHSLQTVLSKCEATHNESVRHWNKDSGMPDFVYNETCFVDWVNNFKNANGSYIDAHKWRFTPESFVAIVNMLNKMNLITLEVDKVHNTAKHSHEFYAVLVKK